jgi:monoamine oxidase
MALDGEGRETDLTAAYDEGEELIAAAQQMASRLEKDMSLKSAIEMMTDWRKADAGERRLLRHVINGTAEAEYGGAWSELSAWHFDDSKEFGGGDVLFPGGYDQIISHLAKGLDIRTGKPVTAIAPQGDGVVVTLADGTVMTADQALVTVPLGVLQAKGISFGAPLAKARRAAVAALGMGLLNKCWLRFERIAWPDDVDWIEWLGPRDGHWEQWVSLARAAKAPVLLGFHAGDMAREMERLSDAEMMQAAHGALKAMFGSDFPAPLDGQITRWSRDPHAFGSYSYHAVGSSPASRKALAGADWEGRLVFAGEACSARYWGTAHGAVLSGREAAEIIAAR